MTVSTTNFLGIKKKNLSVMVIATPTFLGFTRQSPFDGKQRTGCTTVYALATVIDLYVAYVGYLGPG